MRAKQLHGSAASAPADQRVLGIQLCESHLALGSGGRLAPAAIAPHACLSMYRQGLLIQINCDKGFEQKMCHDEPCLLAISWRLGHGEWKVARPFSTANVGYEQQVQNVNSCGIPTLLRLA